MWPLLRSRARSAGGNALLCLALGTAVSCWRREPPPPPDLLLITISDFGAADLDRDPAGATPNLAQLAREGVDLTSAFASAPLSLASLTTLMTGTEPPWHGVRGDRDGHAMPQLTTLAEALRGAGRSTAAAVGADPLRSSSGLSQGFQRYDEAQLLEILGADGRPADPIPRRGAAAVTAAALSAVAASTTPWMLWVHYADASPITGQAEPARARAAAIVALDAEVGRLLRGLPPSPGGRLVALTADRGPRRVAPDPYLVDDTSTHVPLLLSWPGHLPAGMRLAEAVSLVDLAPTLLAQLGVAPPRDTQGADLSPLLRSEARPQRTLYAESQAPADDLGLAPVASLRLGDLRLVRTSRDRLFDLGEDPGQRRDLSAARPEDARRLGAALDELLRLRQRPERPRSEPGAPGAPPIPEGPEATPEPGEPLFPPPPPPPEPQLAPDPYDHLALMEAARAQVFDRLSLEDEPALASLLRSHPHAGRLWREGLRLAEGSPSYGPLLTEAADLFPDDALVAARLASHAVSRGEKGAVGALSRAFEAHHDADRPPLCDSALLYATRAAMDLGRMTEAEELMAALAARPLNRSDELAARAQLGHRMHRLESAEADLGAALARRPGDAELWRQLGVVLLADGRQRDADAALAKSVALAPAQPEVWRLRALMARELGDEATAAERCRQHAAYGGDLSRCLSATDGLAAPEDLR